MHTLFRRPRARADTRSPRPSTRSRPSTLATATFAVG